MISSIRVAVFGITRSGKDYSISSSIETLNAIGVPFKHFPGIPTVRESSIPILGKEFSETSMAEKGLLMDIFRKDISDRFTHPYLIQDEHYSFPTKYGGRPLRNDYTSAKFPFVLGKNENGSEYEIVLKKEWISDSDLVLYLNPDPIMILERIRSSEGSKRNDQITEEDIRDWMDFEMCSLKSICNKQNICLKILDSNENAAKGIVDEIINNHVM